jgi:hypothetical protein
VLAASCACRNQMFLAQARMQSPGILSPLGAGLGPFFVAAGGSERDQTGHRSLQMVRRYIRDGSLFRDLGKAAMLSL